MLVPAVCFPESHHVNQGWVSKTPSRRALFSLSLFSSVLTYNKCVSFELKSIVLC